VVWGVFSLVIQVGILARGEQGQDDLALKKATCCTLMEKRVGDPGNGGWFACRGLNAKCHSYTEKTINKGGRGSSQRPRRRKGRVRTVACQLTAIKPSRRTSTLKNYTTEKRQEKGGSVANAIPRCVCWLDVEPRHHKTALPEPVRETAVHRGCRAQSMKGNACEMQRGDVFKPRRAPRERPKRSSLQWWSLQEGKGNRGTCRRLKSMPYAWVSAKAGSRIRMGGGSQAGRVRRFKKPVPTDWLTART